MSCSTWPDGGLPVITKKFYKLTIGSCPYCNWEVISRLKIHFSFSLLTLSILTRRVQSSLKSQHWRSFHSHTCVWSFHFWTIGNIHFLQPAEVWLVPNRRRPNANATNDNSFCNGVLKFCIQQEKLGNFSNKFVIVFDFFDFNHEHSFMERARRAARARPKFQARFLISARGARAFLKRARVPNFERASHP